jgi:hypothetical protein
MHTDHGRAEQIGAFDDIQRCSDLGVLALAQCLRASMSVRDRPHTKKERLTTSAYGSHILDNDTPGTLYVKPTPTLSLPYSSKQTRETTHHAAAEWRD